MKLTPSERLQLTSLLGALQGGLQGSDALSIFGNIEGDIQSRQDAQRQRKAQMQALALQSAQHDADQKAMMERYLIGQQAKDQQSHYDALQSLLPGILKEGLPQTDRTVVSKPAVDALGQPIPGAAPVRTVTTQTTPGADYSQIMAQIGALSSAVPGGMSGAEFGNLSGAVDAMYTLGAPGAKGPSSSFWSGVQSAVQRGMAAGQAPDQIKKAIIEQAQASGYGSPDEQAMIESQVQALTQGGGGVGTLGTTGTGLSGEVGGSFLGALKPFIGLASAVGAAKGGKYLFGKAKGLFGRTPEVADTASVTPIETVANTPVGVAAQAVPGGGASPVQEEMVAVQKAIQEAIGALPMGARPIGALPAEATGVAGYPIQGEGFAARPGPQQPYIDPGARAMLSEGQPLEATMPGARGGMPDFMGALGSLTLPLSAVSAWAQQRNQQRITQEWYSMAPEQRVAYVHAHPDAFPDVSSVQSDGSVVLNDGRIIDPVTRQELGRAG